MLFGDPSLNTVTGLVLTILQKNLNNKSFLWIYIWCSKHELVYYYCKFVLFIKTFKNK